MPLRRAQGPISKSPTSRSPARRGLTEADRVLWRNYTVIAAVAPLTGKALPSPPIDTLPGPAVASSPPPVMPSAPPSPKPPVARPAELQIGIPAGGIDGKRWRDLRRGRTRPERTLDLHGSRAQDAHAAVRRFLREAQADGLRCVAIVTGKGSSAEGGVLKRELPHWLNAPELRPLLLGAAHRHAANAGAVHLLLRRPAARSPRRP